MRTMLTDLLPKALRDVIDVYVVDVSRPAISQHLSVLRDAGLVEERREGTRRLYRARPEGLSGLREFLDRFWTDRLERLRLAAEADFAIAMYNPRSASRPEGFGRALAVLKESGCGERLVIFARAISGADEKIETVTLNDATPEMADMRTLVIVGNSQTRRVGRWIYAPRQAR